MADPIGRQQKITRPEIYVTIELRDSRGNVVGPNDHQHRRAYMRDMRGGEGCMGRLLQAIEDVLMEHSATV